LPVKYRITNNVLDAVTYPIGYWAVGDEKTRPAAPKSVDIRNNIIRSRDAGGLHVGPDNLAAVKSSWKLGHNCYLSEPTGIPDAIPRQPTDLITQKQFVSVDPKNSDFFRIASDSPLATAGAGGHLPNYIGAFPPGPAPKEGDWFTRLGKRP
jgi:hypothetical protein